MFTAPQPAQIPHPTHPFSPYAQHPPPCVCLPACPPACLPSPHLPADVEFASYDNHYLCSITVNAGKVFAMFIKTPEKVGVAWDRL